MSDPEAAINETVYSAMIDGMRTRATETVMAARDAVESMLNAGVFKRDDQLRIMLAICLAELARRNPEQFPGMAVWWEPPPAFVAFNRGGWLQ